MAGTFLKFILVGTALMAIGTTTPFADEDAPRPDNGAGWQDGADWGPEWPGPMREMMERWGSQGRWMHRNGAGMMAFGMMGPGMMGGDEDGGPLLTRIDGRLAFIKTELHITDAQSAAWDEAAAAIRSGAESHNRDMKAMWAASRDGSLADMTLPERLAFQKAHMESRLKELDTMTAAIGGLYDKLDDGQKKTADEIIMPMTGMGMMGGGRGMMWR